MTQTSRELKITNNLHYYNKKGGANASPFYFFNNRLKLIIYACTSILMTGKNTGCSNMSRVLCIN